MLFSPRDGVGSTPRLPAHLTRWLAALLLASTAIPAEALAGAVLPTGGTVVKGSASIDTGPSGVTVTQTSATGIINWNTFSIGAGNSVRFDNGSGSTLSRVTGNVTSEIDGALTATGTLYLVNPAGVVVGPSGSVFTGGSFIASAHDISNDQYLNAGAIEFSGTSTAEVINAGTIASANGDVALIARKVENSGTISAPNGTAALVAGYDVLMSDASGENGKFAVKVGGAGTSAVNSGTIKAAEIEMRANGGNVYALAGNTDAVIKATSVTASGGRVFLTAGSNGTVKSTAHIVARKRPAKPAARPEDLDGGAITTSGGTVDLAGTVDASAQGHGTTGGTISAIATGHGSYTGLLLARGGESGTGGAVETSGLQGVDFTGVSVDTSATGGITGSWLVDPQDLTVDGAAAATISSNLASTNVTLTTTATTASGIGTVTPGSGDITVASAINWSSANTLTLNAYNDVVILGAITGTSGGLTLSAGNAISAPGAIAVGTYRQMAGAFTQIASSLPSFAATDFQLSGGTFLRATGGDGSSGNPYVIADVYGLQGIGTNLSSSFSLANNIDASGSAHWNSGAGFKSIGAYGSAYSGTFDGNGHQIAGLTINATDQYNVGLFGFTDSASVIRNIGLVGGSVANSGMGTGVGALVGNSYGTIENAYSSASVIGTDGVGGLVGYLNGTVSGSYTTGAVTGTRYVGGLIGASFGTVSDSYATGAATGHEEVGGLAGTNDGTISGSHATGRVIATGGLLGALAGGLVGENNSGTISASYATGDVSGGSDQLVGGLVGSDAYGTIENTYATGDVTGFSQVGGLVGATNASSTITSSYASGNVTADQGAGGLVGINNGTIRYAYALGSVTGHTTSVGGLVGHNGIGTIDQTYATGAVRSDYGYWGGLVGSNSSAGTITNSYWDTQTTGQTAGIGTNSGTFSATGLTTDQFNTASNFSGWTFGTTPGSGWVIVDFDGTLNNTVEDPVNYVQGGNGFTRPFLLSEWSSTITNMHQLELMALDLSAHYTLASDIDAAAELSSGPSGMWRVSGNATSQGYGFVPIGNVYWQMLTGTLDGAGHTISNLSIHNTDFSGYAGYVGLFSVIDRGGLVENLGLQGGSVYAQGPVGALAGGNGGTIRNSHASTSVDGTYEVGGLVGDNAGAIEQSSATGNVQVHGSSGGGLAGISRGTISQSYATGAISGGNGVDSLGGLVGQVLSGGSVTQSYATGAVTGGSGSSGIGGLVGYLDGSITDSYSIGAVTVGSGSQAYGGLVGLLYAGGITDSYFAQEFGLNAGLHGIGRLQSTYAPSDIGVTGETLAALKNASTYAASWDFSLGGVWGINAYTSSGLVNGGLPFFQWEHPIVAAITANNQTTIYNGTATGDGFSGNGYSVAYANGYSSADNLLSNVALAISGSNVNAGTTNDIDISATPTGSYAVMLANGTESIAARTVTVTADNLTRAFGAANPALTYAASGLINGDTLAGGLATLATPSSSPGRYAITEGTLTASANYILDFLPGTLTVGSTTGVPLPNANAAAQGRATPELGPPLTFVSGGSAAGLSWEALVNRPTGAVSTDGEDGAPSGSTDTFALTFAPGTFQVTSFSMASNSSTDANDQTTGPSCSVGVAGSGLGNVPYPCN